MGDAFDLSLNESVRRSAFRFGAVVLFWANILDSQPNSLLFLYVTHQAPNTKQLIHWQLFVLALPSRVRCCASQWQSKISKVNPRVSAAAFTNMLHTYQHYHHNTTQPNRQ